jgi:ribosome recycling factor
MQHLREMKNDGEASSDDEHRAEVELQKLTDGRVGDLDGLLKAKEEEILAV